MVFSFLCFLIILGTVFSLIGIVVYVSTKCEGYYDPSLWYFSPIVVTLCIPLWLVHAGNPKSTIVDHKVTVVDGVALMNKDGKIHNLNEKFERNFTNGEVVKFKVTKPQWLKAGIWYDLDVLEISQ